MTKTQFNLFRLAVAYGFAMIGIVFAHQIVQGALGLSLIAIGIFSLVCLLANDKQWQDPVGVICTGMGFIGVSELVFVLAYSITDEILAL